MLTCTAHTLQSPVPCLTSEMAGGHFICVYPICNILIVCIEKVAVLKRKVFGLCSVLLALVDRSRSQVWRENTRAGTQSQRYFLWHSLPLSSNPSFVTPTPVLLFPVVHSHLSPSVSSSDPPLSFLVAASPSAFVILRLKSGPGPPCCSCART